MTQTLYHCFWTGGFDSTFRICQLLIDRGADVQPIYVVQMGFQDDIHFSTYDEPNLIQKPAMPHEIQAIEIIRGLLDRDFPRAASRLRPIRFIPSRRSADDWPAEKRVSGPGINGGRQYDLLRLVAERYGERIELCIEKSPDGHNAIIDILIPWCEKIGGVWRLRKNLPAHSLDPKNPVGVGNFLQFDLPLLQTTRRQMMASARVGGYEHIIKRSWSCRDFRPTRRPCGTCFCCSGRVRDQVWWGDPLDTRGSGMLPCVN